MVFMQRRRRKDLLLRAHIVVRTSNMNISRRLAIVSSYYGLAHYVKNCIKKRAARAARLLFLIQPIKSLICGIVAVGVVIS